MLELSIKLKSEDAERTYTQRWLVYDELTLNSQDESQIAAYVEEAMKKFGEPASEVKMTIKKDL